MADEPVVVEPVEPPAGDPAPLAAQEPTLLGGATVVEPSAAQEQEPAGDPFVEPKVEEPLKEPEPAPAPLTAADYVLTAPDGVELDPATLAPLQDLAAELQIPKDKAQAILDLHLAQQAKDQAATRTLFETTQAAWKAEVLALPEFTGVEGLATKTAIGRMMDEYASPEVKAILDQTGAGNNPHVVKMFAKVAKALNEGGPTPQGAPPKPNGSRTPGQILYPSLDQ